LASYERKRLIEQNVPFIVPGNQLYLPDLGIDGSNTQALMKLRPKFSPVFGDYLEVFAPIFSTPGPEGSTGGTRLVGYVAVGVSQARVLTQLLNDGRLNRLIENEALASSRADAYSLASMLEDLKRGVWTELDQSRVSIDPYRRTLQNQYLSQINLKLNPPPATTPAPNFPGFTPPAPLLEDARNNLRGELVSLRGDIRRAIPRAADRETRLHLEGVDHQIGDILEPKK
jgi:hypothetical protein